MLSPKKSDDPISNNLNYQLFLNLCIIWIIMFVPRMYWTSLGVNCGNLFVTFSAALLELIRDFMIGG